MDITEVRIVKIIKKGGPLLGFANVVIDNCFAIRGIKIIETEDKGRFISMPSKRRKERFIDICHPINQETRDELQSAILELYDVVVNE